MSADVEELTKNSIRVTTFLLVVLGPVLVIQGALMGGDFLDQFKVPMMIAGVVMLIVGVVLLRFTLRLSYQ